MCRRSWLPGAGVFDTGQGRKTDAADGYAIVMVAVRGNGCARSAWTPQLTVLRLLSDRRDELSQARAQTLNRLHRLFLELRPGGVPAKVDRAVQGLAGWRASAGPGRADPPADGCDGDG